MRDPCQSTASASLRDGLLRNLNFFEKNHAEIILASLFFYIYVDANDNESTTSTSTVVRARRRAVGTRVGPIISVCCRLLFPCACGANCVSLRLGSVTVSLCYCFILTPELIMIADLLPVASADS